MGANIHEAVQPSRGGRRTGLAVVLTLLGSLTACGSSEANILIGTGMSEEQRDNYIDVRVLGGYEDQSLLRWMINHPNKRPTRLIPHFKDGSAGFEIESKEGDNSGINCERVGDYSPDALINPMNYGPPAHSRWMKTHDKYNVILDIPIPSPQAPGFLGSIICWEGTK
ncbi:MAG TPA: hypothetical protein VF733_06515 [Candidatus Saccharimonadales bacterium]